MIDATSENSSPPEPRTEGIQVIRRAGQILRALARERQGVSLSAIAHDVGLPRSTVHRIVVALEAEGLVAVASPNGRYRLGSEIGRLAGDEHGALRLELRPLLDALAARVNETVDLSILQNNQVAFIDQISVAHRLRAVSSVGATFPTHCTANGKALLALHSDETLCKLLRPRLEAYTEKTITDRAVLLEELARVRIEGVAYDREEHTTGISAIGTVVRDSRGVAGAISIPVPTQRFIGNEKMLVDALLEICSRPA